MKYLIIFSLIFSNLYAQNAFHHFRSGTENIIGLIEPDENTYALIRNDSVIYLNSIGELINKVKFNDPGYSIGTILKEPDNELLFAGIYDYVPEQHFNFWFKKTDFDFNIIWEKTHYVDLNGKELAWTWDCIKTYDNELLILLNTDSIHYGDYPDTSFIYRFTETGDFIDKYKFENYTTLRHGNILQLPDTSGYFFYNFNVLEGTDCIFKLKNNFEIDTIYNMFLSGNIDYRPYHDMEFISDSTFIYTGDGYAYDPDYPEIVGVSLYDTAFNDLARKTFGFKDVWNISACFNSLSFIDTSAIYIAYLSPGLHWYPPSELNYSIVVKLNSALDVKWEKFYGDSATMSMDLLNIFATKDSCCIITGDIQFSPFDGTDIKTFIVKLDKDGNLPTAMHEPLIKAHNLILYPNPGNENLNIRTAVQSVGGVFKLYCITGKTVLEAKLNDRSTSIHTDHLPPGTYLYEYILDGKTIESGKWIKK
jgi:hypothetical protein